MAAKPPNGRSELRAVLRKSRVLFWTVALFSIFSNLLVLTGPIFMLQVYDRVLSSRSEATLVALFALVAMLYAIMGILDYARGRILARVGARFQSMLDERVFDALLRRSVDPAFRNRPATHLRDLESIQRLLSSPALLAINDLPWTPIFIFAIFLFHPLMGWLAVVGGSILIIVTVLNQLMSKSKQLKGLQATAAAENFAEAVRRDAEVVQSLGMRQSVLARWRQQRDTALDESMGAADVSGTFTTFSKTFRLFLQSGMLALAAYLVLQGLLTPGAMIAGSILMGRALAPVEQSIAQWSLVQRARQGWLSLAELLERTPEEEEKTELPRPKARLDVKGIIAAPPGEQVPTLKSVSFHIEPGIALGVIGASASGKSTLARVITGIWPPAQGKVRLDGAAIDQYETEVLGQHIGYLPQDVNLFDASVADNVARLSAQPDPAKVVAAAKKAGAHEMILKLPDGYDTVIQGGGGRLSGGQRQRLGLARALYGDPVILVLDEPNANLDVEGSNALNAAVEQMKKNGGSVIIMAHRPAAIARCEMLLLLDQGQVKDFGPRDDVLKKNLKNYDQVAGGLKAPAEGAALPAQGAAPAIAAKPQDQRPAPRPDAQPAEPARRVVPMTATKPGSGKTTSQAMTPVAASSAPGVAAKATAGTRPAAPSKPAEPPVAKSDDPKTSERKS
ncbi:type I secretion system permease/ATPase [Pontivivens insulae]|uniref:Type I secretion system ATP-binding protein PrsD n=1 Tax=Pontivivens insulae TaxID=1639689 RepID=A0A2R8AF73_9RHOB|nr:type I secretion system permease/ATPase [Pontivivens insulae]RED11944.1 ATP-binding cassette subfamily C protein [Pontivivens insulae]SPF30700.1 Type I secretion system ATP-binding protein PrsD [Pontivivens insulae]